MAEDLLSQQMQQQLQVLQQQMQQQMKQQMQQQMQQQMERSFTFGAETVQINAALLSSAVELPDALQKK